jgi:hypothetical protein
LAKFQGYEIHSSLRKQICLDSRRRIIQGIGLAEVAECAFHISVIVRMEPLIIKLAPTRALSSHVPQVAEEAAAVPGRTLASAPQVRSRLGIAAQS